MKNILSLLFALFLLNSVSAQKNNHIWEALLNNKRNDALTLVNKLNTKNDLENLLLKKIVEMENGLMMQDSNFISKISNYPNYEFYVFANWKFPYLFNDYLENGFSMISYELPHLLNASEVNNSTVRNGLYYLQAVTRRHQRKWDEYKTLIDKINVIKEWEYCGVFENLNSSGIDMSYPPEQIASANQTFNTHSKGDASWYKLNSYNEAYNFFTNHAESGSGVHYAQTFVYSPENKRIIFKIGKGGAIRLWLNDVLVLANDEKYITELDAYSYEVNLQKGLNRILVKSATSGEVPYFILRLEDLNGNSFTNFKTSFDDRNYIKSDMESTNPVYIPHSIERYFETKLENSDTDINFNKFCLYSTYYRNGRMNKALALLIDWSEEYPESSFLKTLLIECYSSMDNENEGEKIESNLKRLDPDYYLSLFSEFEESDELMELDIQTYESKLREIGASTNYSFMKTTTDLMILFRQNDREKMRQKLDELLSDETLYSSLKPTFSEFYSTVFNDDSKTITTLEEFNKSEYNWETIIYLGFYLKKQNKIEEVIKLYSESFEHFKGDNNVIYEIIKILHETGQYERSLPFIEQALQNYPNSYLFTKLKGDAYLQLNKKNETLELYSLALSRRPSDKELRAKINDLKQHKNPLNDFDITDAYKYISVNRDVIKTNNYGLNTLLNQTNVLTYLNGGGEYRSTFIYELTSQNGIDIFKEYNLGLSGDYTIKKSEIVKPNGDIVPADRNGANLVFDGLEIGDVILIDYEARYTKTGRFYNDYVLTHNFNGYHPTIKNIYRLLTHDKTVNHTITNGNADYETSKIGGLYLHEWNSNNTSGIPISEDFMPPYDDVSTKIHISSIDSWNDIANWYSDIVRNQLKYDVVVEDTFHKIFPNGYEQFSENEKAEKIYNYITTNINYSHVSFRQSGYIPQKPSKTITTKLGDCKDLSSLFLVLAKQAQLDANLVLILTSDFGENELVMPSSDFNHCIVKVNIDGNEQYLELTDNYLPYRSLPLSLRDAFALDIPLHNTKELNVNLTRLKDVSRLSGVMYSNAIVTLQDSISSIQLTTKASGHVASYYINTFDSEQGKLLEETIKVDISDRSTEVINLTDITNINHDENLGEISFVSNLTSDIELNESGDYFTFKVPYFLNPYTEGIIQNESRFYPIYYSQYENADAYVESVLIKLKKNQEFLGKPQNSKYHFKDHSFEIKYSFPSSNELKVDIVSNVNSKNISPEEYMIFKGYVRKVLDTRDTIIKFKNKT